MADVDEIKLLPCPFCGSEAEIERFGTRSVSTVYQCTNCGCSLETGEEWSHGRDWNKRAALAAAGDGWREERDAALREAGRMREALVEAEKALHMQEAWEGDLIMSELEFKGVPAPTQTLWDKITDELQPSRNAALTAIRAALHTEQT